MKCPYCGYTENKVLDKRDANEADSNRRRRECLKCGRRFTTYETVEIPDIDVIKRNGGREKFDLNKIRRGIEKACDKRPVTIESMDSTVAQIEQDIKGLGKTEITSEGIGEIVMDKLRDLDDIAYLRFASVYKNFTDIGSFEREIKNIIDESHHAEKYKGKLSQIRKRNGSFVDFNPARITNAIYRAAQSVGTEDNKLAERLTESVVNKLEEKFSDKKIPTIEDVQDTIEKVLIENGHANIAKSFILYRQRHTTIRETKSALLDVQNMITGYLKQSDWRIKENSNTNYSFSGLLLYTIGKVVANYMLNEIYTPQMGEAHKDGYIHIHNLDTGLVGYCAGWSLKNLLLMGLGNVENKVSSKPAKHLDVLTSQMVNYIGTLQMEFSGAQAFSGVDTLMAPFVRADKMSYIQVKQCMQRLVFSLNASSRWGSQTPFSNLTFDWTVPKDMENEKVILGGELQDTTYGEYQKEMDLINKAFLEVMRDGDAVGRIFTFPIPTYNLTKDFNWDSPNAQLLFEVTAKYGIPYFQNYIGSGLDPKSIHAMCCRLNLDLNELMNRPGGMWSMGDSTGSIGVVTINMNRLAYESKTKDEFFRKLKHYMLLAKDSLEIKREVIEKNLQTGLMPFTKVYLGSFKNHFSTIGLCGMNEACLNFLGKDISSKEGKELTIETLLFMKELIREFQRETGNLYNLEATPAESTAYRFATLDKKMYPEIITSGKDVPFLTNSTQLPVDHTDDLIEAIDHQNEIQPLYTGGTIFHAFVGEKISDAESCKKIVKRIAYNTKLPYFSITPTFSICKNHGYLKGEQVRCPQCGTETDVYSRIVGYFRPIKNWNEGKREEFKHRKTFLESKAQTHKFKNEISMVKQPAVRYGQQPLFS